MSGKFPAELGNIQENELWHAFNTLEKEQEHSKVDSLAHRCPWGNGEFVDLKEYADMVKFEKHGAHVMLWCPAKETDMMLDKYPLRYRITMQLRFDGTLGFAGGLVDEMKGFNPSDNNLESFMNIIKKGLLREVREELTLTIENEPKYIYSSCTNAQLQQCQTGEGNCVPGYALHFFSCQVPLSALESVERNALEIFSSDEVLGITRVPLYFMRDNVRGLPSFLTNAFIGNCLEQLLRACISEGILTPQQVRFAYYVASILLSSKNK